MKIIPQQYQCEICKRIYLSDVEALECESRKPPIYPKGMIFGGNKNGMYRGMTFAIAQVKSSNHSNDSFLWVCRDTEIGDSLGVDKCSSGNYLDLGKGDTPNPNHPTFKRMVKYLRNNLILITVWDGKKVIFLKNFKQKGNK